MSGMWSELSSSELVFKVQSFFGVEKVDKDDGKKFRIGNKFFYYLFLLGTELGDDRIRLSLLFHYAELLFFRRRTVLRNLHPVLLLQRRRTHRTTVRVPLVRQHVHRAGLEGDF